MLKVNNKQKFDVILIDPGADKLKVIATIKSIYKFLLIECRDLVFNTPSVLEESVDKQKAENAKRAIEKAGGKVELR